MTQEEERFNRFETAKLRVWDLLKDKKIERQEILITTAETILILQDFLALRDSDEVFYYCPVEKMWLKNGEQQIKEISHKINSKFSISDVNEIIAKIKRMKPFNREQLNPGNLLAVKNGVLNTDTDLFEPARMDHYITARLSAKYDPRADCPKIKRFFSEILPEKDKNLLIEAFSYTLHKDYHIHKAFLLLGEGANGKTTALELLESFLGKENVSNVPLQAFEQSQFMSAELFGKRANICADLSGTSLKDLGMLKMLTGNDTVKGERKRCDPFYFKSYAKMFYSMNKLPPIYRDNTHSVWRRIELIEFKRIFTSEEQDPDLGKKLSSDEEMSGFLNLLLENLHNLLERKRFISVRSEAETKIRYKLLSNSSQAFCELLIDIEMNEFVPTAELYEDYRLFCKELNLEVKSKSALMRVLPMNITETFPVRQNKVRGWKNIKVNFDKLEDIKKTYFGDACDAKTTCFPLSPHLGEKYTHSTKDVSFVSHVSQLVLDFLANNGETPTPRDKIISFIVSKESVSVMDANKILDEMHTRGDIFMPLKGTYLKI